MQSRFCTVQLVLSTAVGNKVTETTLTRFWAYLFFIGTHHENLLKSLLNNYEQGVLSFCKPALETVLTKTNVVKK